MNVNNEFIPGYSHVKVTFSLFLERISNKYESFEYFLPGDQNNSFIFNMQPKLTKFDFGAQRREL